MLDRRGATSNFLGYHGFPAVICASPNDMVVHGIPGDDVVLEEGDIISIDCGAIVDGWHGDAAFTAGSAGRARGRSALIEVGRGRRSTPAIAAMVDGGRLGDIGHAVQGVVEGAGFAVVRDYIGHGIGRAMHEEPGGPELRPARHRARGCGRQRARHRADGQRRHRRDRRARRRLERGHRRRLAGPPTPSTPSPSPTTAPRS